MGGISQAFSNQPGIFFEQSFKNEGFFEQSFKNESNPPGWLEKALELPPIFEFFSKTRGVPLRVAQRSKLFSIMQNGARACNSKFGPIYYLVFTCKFWRRSAENEPLTVCQKIANSSKQFFKNIGGHA